MTKCLLILDDEIEIAMHLREVAEGLDYKVTVLSDPSGFLQHYTAVKPDTVIIDIFMPERDGVEIMRELAAAHCTARLLLISGSDEFFLFSTKRLAESMGLHNVTVMQKPLRLKELRGFLTRTTQAIASSSRRNL